MAEFYVQDERYFAVAQMPRSDLFYLNNIVTQQYPFLQLSLLRHQYVPLPTAYN